MTAYPAGTYSPRTKENKPGVEYAPEQTTIGFAEDFSKLDDEVVAIETELGTNPKWSSASVKERLKGIRSLVDVVQDVITIALAKVGIGVNLDMEGHEIKNISKLWGSGGYSDAYFGMGFGGGDTWHTNYGFSTSDWELSDALYIRHIFAKTGDGLELKDIGGHYGIKIANGGNVGIGTASPTAQLDVDSDILRLRTAKTPATAGSAGNAGDVCWDTNYIYICVATNTWKRSAIATW